MILTNPPFGGEEERGILSNFPKDKQTTETTLLFLQLGDGSLRIGVIGGDSHRRRRSGAMLFHVSEEAGSERWRRHRPEWGPGRPSATGHAHELEVGNHSACARRLRRGPASARMPRARSKAAPESVRETGPSAEPGVKAGIVSDSPVPGGNPR